MSIKHKLSNSNIPLRSGGAARSVSAHVGKRVGGRVDSPTKQLRVNWESCGSGRATRREGIGEGYVPGRPRRSSPHLHHPILLLANSPYLERKEGSGGW